MREFVSIDFETGNPKRVSACALGYAIVDNYNIVQSRGYLIKPVGGHAAFQSKIHGIEDEHTADKPTFGELFHEIKAIFNMPLVGHSLFDKLVLNALSIHFDLGIEFSYIDSCGEARKILPDLKDHKLKTLAKYYDLPPFKHHDAEEDAIACANIFLKLHGYTSEKILSADDDFSEFIGLSKGILADGEVNYKEAYELLYWLEDHKELAGQQKELYAKVQEVLEDDYLDEREAIEIKNLLVEILTKNA